MATTLFRGGADTHTVMAAGGWASAEAMSKYVLVDIGAARRGYDEAQRRLAKEQHLYPPPQPFRPPSFWRGAERKRANSRAREPVGDVACK